MGWSSNDILAMYLILGRSDSDYGDFTVISKQDIMVQVSNAELFYNTVKIYLKDITDNE